MLNGTKIRGRDDGENFILINSLFYKVTAELVSFEFLVCPDEIPNIQYIGYSKPLKQLYVHFRNGNRYIYQKVSVDQWQARHNYEKINHYYNREIKGIGYFKTDECLKQIPNEYVMSAYNKLEYYATLTEGMWATDRPDLVVDPQNILFELKVE